MSVWFFFFNAILRKWLLNFILQLKNPFFKQKYLINKLLQLQQGSLTFWVQNWGLFSREDNYFIWDVNPWYCCHCCEVLNERTPRLTHARWWKKLEMSDQWGESDHGELGVRRAGRGYFAKMGKGPSFPRFRLPVRTGAALGQVHYLVVALYPCSIYNHWSEAMQ